MDDVRVHEREREPANTLESNDMLLHFGAIARGVAPKISRRVASYRPLKRIRRTLRHSGSAVRRATFTPYSLWYIYISLDHVFSQTRVHNEFITRSTLLSPRVLIKHNEHSRRTRNVFQQ